MFLHFSRVFKIYYVRPKYSIRFKSHWLVLRLSAMFEELRKKSLFQVLILAMRSQENCNFQSLIRSSSRPRQMSLKEKI